MDQTTGQMPQVQHDGTGPFVFQLPRQVAKLMGCTGGDIVDPEIADRVGAIDAKLTIQIDGL